jgi:hypothetical protein
MRVAAQASDFKIDVTSIEGVTECRRRLGQPAQAEHATVPGLAGELVGFLPRRRGGCSEARTELPKIRSRDLVPMGADNAPCRGEPASRHTL